MRRIKDISENTAKAFDQKVEVTFEERYPPVVNHKKETEHVIRLTKKWFGEEYSTDDKLPLSASEDFSYFLEEKPGCFFMLGTMKPDEISKPKTLHDS